MKSWKRNLEYLREFNDITLALFRASNLNTATEIRIVCRAFLLRFQNNLMGCDPFVENLSIAKGSMLSLGLIMRGIVSDLINYRFLQGVYQIGGEGALSIELHRLEAVFTKAYREMLEMEHDLMKSSEAIREAGFKKLEERLPDYFENGKLKSVSSFSTDGHSKLLKNYFQTIAEVKEDGEKEQMPNLSTEAGKLKFLGKHSNIVQLNLVYKYLSQFQHFSINSEKLFSHEGKMPHEYFMELLIVLVCEAIIEIIEDTDICQNTGFTKLYRSLAERIVEVNDVDLEENEVQG